METNPRLIALSLLGLAGGIASFVADRFQPEAEEMSSEKVQNLTPMEKRNLERQAEEMGRIIRELPEGEEAGLKGRAEKPDFRAMELTTETLSKFPKKDAPPVALGGSVVMWDPDTNNWRTLEQQGLSREYNAVLDELVVDTDETSVHVYAPSIEDLDIVLSMEEIPFGDEQVIFMRQSDGMEIWSRGVDSYSTEDAQEIARKQIQSEIVTFLAAQER
jgi:hypothetical protein